MIREAIARPVIGLARWLVRERPSNAVPLPGWADWMIGTAHALPDEAFIYPDAYRLLPDVYAVISLIQEKIASLPLKFYKGDTELTPAPGNVAGIWQTGNPFDTGNLMMQQIVGSLDIAGNGYVFKDYMGTTQVRELRCLSPQRVKPIPGPNMGVQAYAYDSGNGRWTIIPGDQILHFRRYDTEHSVVGMSPLSAAMMRLLTQRDQQRWMRNTYKQGGTVAGFFSTEKGMDDDTQKRLREQMMARFGGPEAAGKPVILPLGLKFERQALTMSELQFLETAKLTSADIYNIFHVPPVIMGVKHGGGLSDAGASTDMLLFYENCILPRCLAIESTINEMLLGALDAGGGEFGPNLTCRFDLSGVLPLQDVFLRQAKLYVEITGRPVMTAKEARERLGLRELKNPEYDTLYEPKQPEIPNALSQGDGPRRALTPHDTTDGAAVHSIRNNDRSRSEYRRKNHARMNLHERRAKRTFTRLFRSWEKRAIARLGEIAGARVEHLGEDFKQRVGPVNVEELVDTNKADERLVRRFLRAVMEDAMVAGLSDLAADLSLNMFSTSAASFIEGRTHLVLDSTMQTTWKELRKALAEKVGAQATLPQLEEVIREVMAGRIQSSVDTIARTEVVSAFNFGNFEAFTQAGPEIVERVVWITARDERVRDGEGTGHDEAEGQERIVGQPFNVRGSADLPFESMRFPGDPTGSPGNTINCRCALMPIPAQARTTDSSAMIVDDDVARMLAPKPRRLMTVSDSMEMLALLGGERNGRAH